MSRDRSRCSPSTEQENADLARDLLISAATSAPVMPDAYVRCAPSERVSVTLAIGGLFHRFDAYETSGCGCCFNVVIFCSGVVNMSVTR